MNRCELAIYRLLIDGSYSSKEIRFLTHAYEGALHLLNLRRTDPKTYELAKVIIEVAKCGESDPSRICEIALRGFGKETD